MLVSVATMTTTGDVHNTDNFSSYHWTATIVAKISKSFPFYYNTQNPSETYNTSFDLDSLETTPDSTFFIHVVLSLMR